MISYSHHTPLISFVAANAAIGINTNAIMSFFIIFVFLLFHAHRLHVYTLGAEKKSGVPNIRTLLRPRWGPFGLAQLIDPKWPLTRG